MSAFEYVSVLASIIIGLALVDILVSLNRLIRTGREVRWHWAAPLAALLVTLTIVQIWWSLFRPEGAPMTIGQFLPLLVEMVILFLLAAASLPDEQTPDGMDLRAYYDRNGPYFWALFTAALAWPVLIEGLEAGLNGRFVEYAADRWLEGLVLVVFTSLIFVRRLWWHAIAFAFFSLGPINWLSRSL